MSNINEWIAGLRAKVATGITAQDHLVLRALENSEIRARLDALLSKGYSLCSAVAVASAVPNVGQVLFQVGPVTGPNKQELKGTLASFELLNNDFLSLSEVFPMATFQGVQSMGALPFALATPSFSRAAAVATSDPKLQQNWARGDAFRAGLGARVRRSSSTQVVASNRAMPKFSSGTSVGCYEDTPYNTSESYDTNGTTDWHVVTDHAQDWVIDDIVNDDDPDGGTTRAPIPSSARPMPKFSSGTSVGCYEDTPYNTNESYDTNGTTDWHVVTDHAQDWVIDDIVNDDDANASATQPAVRASARALPRFSSGTSVGSYEDTAYNCNESYDTGGTTDWHVVTDYCRDWVIDDITNDDAP